MTCLEILSKGFAGAIGKPVEECQEKLRVAMTIAGIPCERMNAPVPTEQAERVIDAMSKDPGSVRRWLAEGAIRVRSGRGKASPAMLQQIRMRQSVWEARN
jgi:hypothetical protein